MKKKTKYLDFYMECMEAGKIPENGLCNCFYGDELFSLIDPEFGARYSYWGFEGDEWEAPQEQLYYSFTELRQNVVLLMAAMNDEL